jgi:hypothetical protein
VTKKLIPDPDPGAKETPDHGSVTPIAMSSELWEEIFLNDKKTSTCGREPAGSPSS